MDVKLFISTLGPKIVEQQFEEFKAYGIEWKLQDATSKSIVFYKISNDSKQIELFRDRISKSEYGLVIINQKIPNPPKNYCVVEDKNWMEVQRVLLDCIYPIDQNSFKKIGVTGTNGKTTCVDFIAQIAKQNGIKTLSIGTLGIKCGEKDLDTEGMTTPCYIDIRKILFKYKDQFDLLAIELSSHSLKQQRVFEIIFDSMGWTSFSQDHLDFHKDMDDYFESKCLAMDKHLIDGESIYIPSREKELQQKLKNHNRKFNIALEISLPENAPGFLKACFNLSNLEISSMLLNRVYKKDLKYKMESFTVPSGRFNFYEVGGRKVIIDFAHTPDALINICQAIKKSFNGQLHVVFGCGGDRDRLKRPLMANAVEENADYLYVTSDNPRNEDPVQIIEDIFKGLKSQAHQKEIDRKLAIEIALNKMEIDDTLLIAGKGHEAYQLVKEIKHVYNDKDAVIEIAKKLGFDFK